MNEYASVAMTGIQAMWSVRQSFHDPYDTYLVQSFVGETRVLGVVTNKTSNDEEMMQHDPNEDTKNNDSRTGDDDEGGGGTLEEVLIPGLEPSASSLYIGNVQCGDRLLQITESEVLLIANNNRTDGIPDNSQLLDTWSGEITVASANEAGQIVLAMAGGHIVYLSVAGGNKILKIYDKQMDREVSCINLNPFVPSSSTATDVTINNSGMDIDGTNIAGERLTFRSSIVAVGLWDDFTVRLLSLDNKLEEIVCLSLSSTDNDNDEAVDTIIQKNSGSGSLVPSTNQRKNRNNTMARSLCLITLDIAASLASSNTYDGVRMSGHHERISNIGVNMLFVGLGDGTLISFAVAEVMGVIQAQSRKEVCLGSQCISLVPLKYVFSSTPLADDQTKSQHRSGACILATGDRPTVIYLAGIGGSCNGTGNQLNPKLCYSNVNVTTSNLEDDVNSGSRPPSHQSLVVNVATPFFTPLLFGEFVAGIGSHQQYSLCVADGTNLRLGVIDDIQKLHVTTCRLGMAPRRIVHCPDGRLFAVGCIESGIRQFGFLGDEGAMGNCIRFIDDTTFDDLHRIDLEPFEMILSISYATMYVPFSVSDRNVFGCIASINSSDVTGESQSTNVRNRELQPFLLVGTGYALPDEDEPTRGRILVYSCQAGKEINTDADRIGGRIVRQISEFSTEGGVYSLTQFFDGLILASVNSRTHICQLVHEDGPGGMLNVQYVGNGHFGHILSLFTRSQAKSSIEALANSVLDLPSDQTAHTAETTSTESNEEMIAIVGDLMRSISLVQYFPQHQTLEEIARDFNVNWTTAIEMLTDSIYLGAENWNNFFCLRRNTASSNEEVRCRLDTVGEYHFGEMCNKFRSGSLVMPVSASANSSSKSLSRRNRPLSPSKKNESMSPVKAISNSNYIRRPVVVTGSQTLFGTTNGTLGIVLGMDAGTAAFFSALERAMANPKVIRPIGDFLHSQYRACHAERRIHPAHGFVDGDLIESFLDLDRITMEAVVTEMNREGGWEVPSDVGVQKDEKESSRGDGDDRLDLTVDDVLAMVEEITMLH
jgi:DNA damage-binding protein 1